MSRDVVKEINKISKLVLSITEDEFQELEEICRKQEDYFNPLKCATTARQHQLAEHNKKMINCLKTLKQQLIEGSKIQ